jgi:hypothetical protein
VIDHLLGVFEGEGADGANGYAFGALRAYRIDHRFIQECGDYSLKASSRKTNGSDSQLFLAYPDAFAAENAFIRIKDKNGTGVIDRKIPLEFAETIRFYFYPEGFCDPEEFTRPPLFTMGTVKRMIG